MPPKPPSPPMAPLNLLSIFALPPCIVSSLPKGRVGDPARDSKDGVVGPENSALVRGRGPDASEPLRDKDAMAGLANDGLRELGRDGNGDANGLSSEGKAAPTGPADSCRCGMGGRTADMPNSAERCMMRRDAFASRRVRNSGLGR
jgi:hypothetical protein